MIGRSLLRGEIGRLGFQPPVAFCPAGRSGRQPIGQCALPPSGAFLPAPIEDEAAPVIDVPCGRGGS
jgi:hypothetical protein